MTMPANEIEVICPNCGIKYDDWTRGSLNLDLDNFDNAYLDKCSSSVCPHCKHKVHHNVLTVKKGGWRVS